MALAPCVLGAIAHVCLQNVALECSVEAADFLLFLNFALEDGRFNQGSQFDICCRLKVQLHNRRLQECMKTGLHRLGERHS